MWPELARTPHSPPSPTRPGTSIDSVVAWTGTDATPEALGVEQGLVEEFGDVVVVELVLPRVSPEQARSQDTGRRAKKLIAVNDNTTSSS
jgi:hypothetical protein